jgi:hypothetical protein
MITRLKTWAIVLMPLLLAACTHGKTIIGR